MAVTDFVRHSQSVPFVRTLGAQWVGGDAAGIRMLLPCADRVSDGAGRIDLRAVVALLDHAGGAAVYAAVPSAATATLELRIDLNGAPEPGCDVHVAARVAAQGRGSALVQGHAACGAAPPFIALAARYIVGSAPGQAPADAAYAAARDAAAARHAALPLQPMASFEHTLGGTAAAAAEWSLPFAERLVGSVTLPALHGGVVAAGLMTAARAAAAAASPRMQLASLTVRFLRAARAESTLFSAQPRKAGARALFLDGQALQGDRLVATLQALFG